MSDGTLAALGWTDELEAAFTPVSKSAASMPARVVAEHRGGYYVRSLLGDRLASARGRMRDDELWGGMPAVGDWVVVCDAPGDRFAIEALLPRRTKVSRKTPWLKAEEHILVANVDTVLLVAGLDADFNPRRLERYLTAAWDSGADPVIVLTKLDVCDDPGKLAEAEMVAVGVPVLAVSNVTGEGIDGVQALLQPAKTFVLLGSSGTGKSTLVNRLAGRTVMETGDLRKATVAVATRRGIVSSSSCPTARSSSTRPGSASSRSGRATSTARSPTSPIWRRSASSTTARTRRSRTARYARRSSRASSTRIAGGTTSSSSASCARSRRGAATASSGSSRAAGGRALAKPGAPAAMEESRRRYLWNCVIQ